MWTCLKENATWAGLFFQTLSAVESGLKEEVECSGLPWRHHCNGGKGKTENLNSHVLGMAEEAAGILAVLHLLAGPSPVRGRQRSPRCVCPLPSAVAADSQSSSPLRVPSQHSALSLLQLVLDSQKRVFSWGFGGYGRLGHAEQKDEMVPRLVKLFDFPGRGASQIYAGYTCSFAVSEVGQ